jgi:hypothetical protein
MCKDEKAGEARICSPLNQVLHMRQFGSSIILFVALSQLKIPLGDLFVSSKVKSVFFIAGGKILHKTSGG